MFNQSSRFIGYRGIGVEVELGNGLHSEGQ
jgi:hypothetical protein